MSHNVNLTDTSQKKNFFQDKVQGLIGLLLVLAAVTWVFASAGFGSQMLSVTLPVLSMAGIYAISASGLNIQYSLGGLMNFGFVGFLACGAYITVLLVPNKMGAGSIESAGVLPLWAAVIVAVVATGLLGALFALPTLRVRGDYFAIIMIASAELIRVTLKEATEFTGGVYGILNYSSAIQDIRPALLDKVAHSLNVIPYQLWIFTLIWLAVLVVCGFTAFLFKSRWALLARAVRADEYGVRSLGKNPSIVKLQSLIIGGCIGGLAGSLFAFQLSQVNPDIFIADVTFFAFTVLLLGGAGTAMGPVVGGVVFWVLYTQSGAFISDVFGSSTAAASARYILVGVLLTALFVFRPQGVMGRKTRVAAKGGNQ